jgi:uncharacterized protein with HEPN domain
MTRDYRDYLQDILDAIDETAEFTAGLTYDAFTRDRKTTNAVVRSLEVLGEAAKRIPDSLRAKAAEMPWKRMAGMRDKLIHEYSGVDLGIVWTVIKEELPPVRSSVQRLLMELEMAAHDQR